MEMARPHSPRGYLSVLSCVRTAVGVLERVRASGRRTVSEAERRVESVAARVSVESKE